MAEIVPAGTRIVSGQLAILACPAPLCPHLEFAAAVVLGVPVSLEWSPQPARPGTVYAALEWRAPAGTAGHIASRLASVTGVSFEVTETAAPGCDAERYCVTPELGLHHAVLGAAGDVLVPEGQLHALLASTSGPQGRRTPAGADASALAEGLHRLLGVDWDDALEPLRAGADGAPVTYLRRTG